MDWRDRIEQLILKDPRMGRPAILDIFENEGVKATHKEVQNYLKEKKNRINQIAPDTTAQEIEQETTAETCKVTTRSKDIQSPEQALKSIGINPDAVEITKQRVKTSEVTIGAENTGTGKPETYTNFHVHVEWKNQVWRNSLVNYIERKVVPRRSIIRKYSGGDHLLVPSIYDHHFGKLAWEPETGSSYDIKIAKQLFVDAIEVLLAKSKVFGIDQIQIPIGQDFLHIDNHENTTAAGTRQDVDTRLLKIMDVAIESIIESVEMCRQVAPTALMWVPGNHDPLTSYFICQYIAAYYRNAEGVTVDVSKKPRKYIKYGRNLIGSTHGQDEKKDSLPLIMATEEGDAFAKAVCKEWHTGHFHTRRETKYLTADTFGPVLVRTLPSLCGTDYWHYKKGYVGGPRAADAYLYHKDTGFAGMMQVNIGEIVKAT